jgi:hypothetical protein
MTSTERSQRLRSIRRADATECNATSLHATVDKRRGEERRREKKKGREEDLAGTCVPAAGEGQDKVHVQDQNPESNASQQTFVALPCVGKGSAEYLVTEKQVADWQVAFPGVDVRGEALRAHAWLLANPTKRKTFGGAAKFLVSWLGRAQDRAGQRGPSQSQPDIRSGWARAEDQEHPSQPSLIDARTFKAVPLKESR